MSRVWFAKALALAALAGSAAQAQDVLPPQRAFPYTARATAGEVVLEFDVLDGYYLYRDRFGFASDTPGVTLGAPRFPDGEIHSDEFFGEQVVFRRNFEIAVPYTRTGGASELDLSLRLQGCADIGLCYPPQNWRVAVDLPAAGAPAAGGAPGVLSRIFPRGEEELLPPEQAFVMNARFDRPNELTVSWQIAEDYYLYRDKLEIDADGDIELGEPRIPEGVAHYDDNFGDVRVFYDYLEAVVPFARASPAALPVSVTAVFQGCKEGSVCYPPITQTMALTLPATSEFAPAAPPDGGEGRMVSEQDRWSAVILGGSWWALLGGFYVAGLLLSFTPCVLPMVPILSGIIAGQGNNVSTGRGFALSLAYVLGMAFTYTGAGALAALAGSQIQAAFQQPWIIVLFAGLFAALALGMFGVYELQMPTAIQTRMANLANRQKAGTFAGVAVMGALTALIVTTCVAPPLVGALAVIGQEGDVVRGASALFALSIGMGSPLLLVGASAGRLLPRVGPWMNTVKAGFGVMMLGLAIWMLERVLPGTVTLLLWALLVFLTGVFLGAFEPLPPSPPAARRLAKGIGVLACLYGALLLIGATLGGEDPLRPLPRGLTAGGPAARPAPALAFQPIESVAELERALADARAGGRPVMIDFTADWCVSCKEMEEYTFPDAGVVAALEPFVLLRADVTENDDDDQALLEYFQSYGPPTIAFFDRSGAPQPDYKLVGYVPADDFAAHVSRLAAL
ncbi:MAG TPA: protein-disulfide reductase DsbD [Gammaproteobacteria bacterium]